MRFRNLRRSFGGVLSLLICIPMLIPGGVFADSDKYSSIKDEKIDALNPTHKEIIIRQLTSLLFYKDRYTDMKPNEYSEFTVKSELIHPEEELDADGNPMTYKKGCDTYILFTYTSKKAVKNVNTDNKNTDFPSKVYDAAKARALDRMSIDNEVTYGYNHCFLLDYQYDMMIKRGAELIKKSKRHETTTNQLEVRVIFRTTKDQDGDMDKAANDIVKKLQLAGKSDFEKVAATYKYFADYYSIEDRKKYTYIDKNTGKKVTESDPYSILLTPYSALVKGKAVCQGFAQAMQIVLIKAGVDCWYVQGDELVENEFCPHGWNMVKLSPTNKIEDTKYYYLDIVNDLPTKNKSKRRNPAEYESFLKGYNPEPGREDKRIRVFSNHYQKIENGVRQPLVRLNVSKDTNMLPYPYQAHPVTKKRSSWYVDYQFAKADKVTTDDKGKRVSTISWTGLQKSIVFVEYSYSTDNGKTWVTPANPCYGIYTAAKGSMTFKMSGSNVKYKVKVISCNAVKGNQPDTILAIKEFIITPWVPKMICFTRI